jgi:hypothetical protein
MTKSNSDSEILREAKLSWRDWILLPALSLLTIVVMVVTAETLARRVFGFGESKTSLNSCLVLNDPETGVRGIPNSVCSEKLLDTQLVEYKFDCSGYRTDKMCGPKPPGTYRIVLIGSSIAMGEGVPVEKTFATSLPEQLSKRVGRQVELYNYGMAFGFPRNTALRFNDVLAAKPDLILWVVSSVDIKLADFRYAEYSPRSASSQPSILTSVKTVIKDKIGGNPLSTSVKALGYLLQKEKSQSKYIQSYLALPNGSEGDWDSGPNALRASLNQEWKERIKQFESYAADIEKRARAASVPIVVVMVPNRAQAAMISMGEWPDGFDPFTLDKELSSVITSYGGTYIDILPNFRTTSNPEQHFYLLNGHPDADGHAIITGFLTKELTNGAVPELRAAMQSDGALEQVK